MTRLTPPPFWLRRPALIVRDLIVSRERPDLARLAGIADPEAFVWAILPHAARTFAACIALLPARSALPAAVAYLYCRMLDTYEDLVADPATRDAALATFAARLRDVGVGGDARALAEAPGIVTDLDRDDRDRAHLLLVRRAALVDAVFLSFDAATRRVVSDLVGDMADGMRWSSAVFHAQGGVLTGEAQLARYCRNVLGNPVVFGVRLLRLQYGLAPELSAREREDAMLVGEMVQLANITRDVEKDLRRGVAYDPLLKSDLGVDISRLDAADAQLLAQRCRAVRTHLLRLALERVPAYRRVVDAIQLPKWSVARASAVLMLLFTERYFRHCARRAGLRPWEGPNATLALFARSIPAAFSRSSAVRELQRIESAFQQLATTALA